MRGGSVGQGFVGLQEKAVCHARDVIANNPVDRRIVELLAKTGGNVFRVLTKVLEQKSDLARRQGAFLDEPRRLIDALR